jgi:UDP-N-acetylmuramoyl-tripeptide--D-alanyl-D-alanine ligase
VAVSVIAVTALASAAHAGEKPGQTLTREILDRSLALGREHLLSNQKPEGNFNYQYQVLGKRFLPGDSEVRQAGALWGLALIHQDDPTTETRQAIVKGLSFFRRNSQVTEDGRRYPVYPGSPSGRTGTVALVTLTLIDLLRAEGDLEGRDDLETELDQYLAFLLSLRTADGHFHGGYAHTEGTPMGEPSPYFDGETLLSLVKAAKYLDRSTLRPEILESAATMYERWVDHALIEDTDSPLTKGFYQWGSMSYYELYTTKWPGTEIWADRVIELAYWMIDIHRTLDRRRNTAYAYEGIIPAWELARLTGNHEAQRTLGEVIALGLTKLTSWQIGGPLENPFFGTRAVTDRFALGGVMNAADDPILRIDVTQHQMHAVLLARRFVYTTQTGSE